MSFTTADELRTTQHRGLIFSLMSCLFLAGLVGIFAHDIARAWDASYWWFLHATGSDAPGSVEYNFWSGFGSDIGEVTVVGMLIGAYKVKLNCHTPGCPWPGHHTVTSDDGVTIRQCHKHHPGVGGKLKAHHIERAHAEHTARMTDS